MLKWIASLVVALLACAWVAFSLLQDRSLRHASLVAGRNQLRVAYEQYTKHGDITNYSTSGYRVWRSTNVVILAATPYRLFAEVDGGWGYGGGRFAMDTNQTLIWLDPERVPKIITNGYLPGVFSTRF